MCIAVMWPQIDILLLGCCRGLPNVVLAYNGTLTSKKINDPIYGFTSLLLGIGTWLLLSFTVFIYLQLKVLILKLSVINNILQYTLDNIFFVYELTNDNILWTGWIISYCEYCLHFNTNFLLGNSQNMILRNNNRETENNY